MSEQRNSKSNSKKVEQAIELARQVHSGHKRLTGESYADHTVRVFEKLKKYGILDETTLIAALLHHSLDYSNEPEAVIVRLFGGDTVELIRNFRKVAAVKVNTDTPNNLNEKYLIQAYVNMAKDIRTLIIRLADKADNLANSMFLPREKREQIANKALFVYSPLARIIGVSRLTAELENNAFKIIDPGEYLRLEKIISKKIEKSTDVVEETKRFLQSIFAENGIRVTIQHRVKHLYGLYRKAVLRRSEGKDPGKNLSEIHDIIAMRVLVKNVADCYLVENLLKEALPFIPEEHDDYIKNPRKSGYKSLHNVFKIARGLNMEIQVKTHDMHLYNEFGPASHLLYKIGDNDRSSAAVDEFKKYLVESPNWFKEINYWEKERGRVDFKANTPFSKFVYAFTPKGDIIELEKGATVLDFAYAVHTKLGHSCIGAVVNGQMVKLSQEVHDGDYVEIKTLRSKLKPSDDWLNIAKTKRAISHIKRGLKDL